MALDRSQLLKMTCEQLDELFAKSPAGSLPDGEGRDTILICEGTWLRRYFAWLVRCFWWQGHLFDAKNGRVQNRLTPFGIRAIGGTLTRGKSLIDQRECSVIDYSKG